MSDAKVIYYDPSLYTKGWFLIPHTKEDWNVVLIVEYTDPSTKESARVVVYLNPTDARWYRCLVRVENPDDMRSTFNQEVWKSVEFDAITTVLSLMSKAYTSLPGVVSVQFDVAGNNSMDYKDGVVHIGTEREPNFPHGHVRALGDPKCHPLGEDCLPLNCHEPGQMPNMRGTEMHPKHKWTTEDIENSAPKLIASLRKSAIPLVVSSFTLTSLS
jgi:HIT domain-containing protein